MRSILKSFGRLMAVMVAGVLALTIVSAAPSSAAPSSTSGRSLPAASSADGHVSARTLARRAPRCWRLHRRCYGSIAVNPHTGRAFIANDKMGKIAARHTANRKCKRHAHGKYCRNAGWVRNGCLAVAYRVRDGKLKEWASAGAATELRAKRRAKRKVRGPGTEHIWAWLCTTRPA